MIEVGDISSIDYCFIHYGFIKIDKSVRKIPFTYGYNRQSGLIIIKL